MGNRGVIGTHVDACCDEIVDLKPQKCHHLEAFDPDLEAVGSVSTFDPAGTVFQETLEGLDEVDRLLLSFCSSANLAAVRWLFALGANAGASDSNGTTCLHAACRSGSLAVVRELINIHLPLNAADAAGWTPMHVACFMERRSIGLYLIQSGAQLKRRNLKGLMPVELCRDYRLQAVLCAAAHRRLSGPNMQWKRESDMGEDVLGSCEFNPSWMPRKPVLNASRCAAFLELGVEIFNQQPGHGLAFLVATGTIENSPVGLSTFMQENRVDPVQVGEFLGENVSLAQALRLQVINTIALRGTGIVGCLAKVFESFQIPSNLHKIDRLVEGVARVWWRQHEALLENCFAPRGSGPDEEDGSEVEGLNLMRQLASPGALHQLLLSTVLLHWSLHTPVPPCRRVGMLRWQAINAAPGESKVCVDPAGTIAMRRIHTSIYNQISSRFFPQLQFWPSRDAGTGVQGASNEVADKPPAGDPGLSSFTNSMSGWAMLADRCFPTMPGSSGTVTYRHLWSLLSESVPTAMPKSRCHSDAGGERRPGQVHCRGMIASVSSLGGSISGCSHERVWLSLQCGVLFLSHRPGQCAPYAFIHMSDVVITGVDALAATLTLALGGPPQQGTRGRGREAAAKGFSGDPPGSCQLAEDKQLQLIFLLPDACWRVIGIPDLQLRLSSLLELQLWRRRLEEHALMVESGGIFSLHQETEKLHESL